MPDYPDMAVRPGESKEAYRERIARETEAAREESEASRHAELAQGAVPVVIDIDDYGFLTPGHEDLLLLRKSFPKLKVTAFTVPLPKEFYATGNAKHFSWEKYRKWARVVNSLGWLEVAVHGFSHVRNECYTSYPKAVTTITAAEKLLARVGLRYVRVWRAPYWQMSYDFAHALRDRGWTVALNRDAPRPVPEGTRTYTWNWSLDEALPQRGAVLGHGHFRGDNRNNIIDTFGNILKRLPTSASFATVGEYLEKYGEKQDDMATGLGDGGGTGDRG